MVLSKERKPEPAGSVPRGASADGDDDDDGGGEKEKKDKSLS
jgi:hypothetical protein